MIPTKLFLLLSLGLLIQIIGSGLAQDQPTPDFTTKGPTTRPPSEIHAKIFRFKRFQDLLNTDHTTTTTIAYLTTSTTTRAPRPRQNYTTATTPAYTTESVTTRAPRPRQNPTTATTPAYPTTYTTTKAPRPPLLSASDRIVGGEDAQPSEFPFVAEMVAVNWKRERVSKFCGGTILNKRWILTAAHCKLGVLMNEARGNVVQVVVGAHNISDLSEPAQQIVKVAAYFQHPQFFLLTIDYDFMLIKLASDLKLNQKVTALGLVSEEGSIDELEGTNCTAIGWGLLKGGTYNQPSILQKVTIGIWNQARCKKAMQGLPGWITPSVTPRMICAQSHGKGGCKGDSGNSLTCDLKGKGKVLVGVTSWGDGQDCDAKKFPTVYSRVSSELGWIRQTMKENE